MYRIGTDILKVSRLTERLAHRILGEKELEIYRSYSNTSKKMEFAAGRFAAKEALVKALGNRSLDFKSIEFLKDENGAPVPSEFVRNLAPDSEIQVTISHESEYAVAIVLIAEGVRR